MDVGNVQERRMLIILGVDWTARMKDLVITAPVACIFNVECYSISLILEAVESSLRTASERAKPNLGSLTAGVDRMICPASLSINFSTCMTLQPAILTSALQELIEIPRHYSQR